MTWLVGRRASAESREAAAASSAHADEEAAHLAQALRISEAAHARSTASSAASSASSASSSSSFEGGEYSLTFDAGGLGLSVAVGKFSDHRGLPVVCRADGPSGGSPKHLNAGPSDAHLPRVGHVVVSFKSNTSNGFSCALDTLGDPDMMYDALIAAVSAPFASSYVLLEVTAPPAFAECATPNLLLLTRWTFTLPLGRAHVCHFSLTIHFLAGGLRMLYSGDEPSAAASHHYVWRYRWRRRDSVLASSTDGSPSSSAGASSSSSSSLRRANLGARSSRRRVGEIPGPRATRPCPVLGQPGAAVQRRDGRRPTRGGVLGVVHGSGRSHGDVLSAGAKDATACSASTAATATAVPNERLPNHSLRHNPLQYNPVSDDALSDVTV